MVDRTEIVDPEPIVRLAFLMPERYIEFSDRLLSDKCQLIADTDRHVGNDGTAHRSG